MRSRGGKGVIFPPWNFQTHVILPNFAQKRHKLGHFHKIFSTLPPLSLRPYASAAEYHCYFVLGLLCIIQGRYNVYGLTVWTRPCFEVGCTKCSKLDFFDLLKRKIPFLKSHLKRKITSFKKFIAYKYK